jgi:hypothetical protein
MYEWRHTRNPLRTITVSLFFLPVAFHVWITPYPQPTAYDNCQPFLFTWGNPVWITHCVILANLCMTYVRYLCMVCKLLQFQMCRAGHDYVFIIPCYSYCTFTVYLNISIYCTFAVYLNIFISFTFTVSLYLYILCTYCVYLNIPIYFTFTVFLYLCILCTYCILCT